MKKEIANGFNNYVVNIEISLAQQITSTINPLSDINTNINRMYIPDLLKTEIITAWIRMYVAGHLEEQEWSLVRSVRLRSGYVVKSRISSAAAN